MTQSLWRPPLDMLGLPLHRNLVAALTAALFMAMIGIGARVSARLSGAPLPPIVLTRWLDGMTWPSLMVFAGISITFLFGHGASYTDPLVVWGSREWGKFMFACTVTAGYAAGDYLGHGEFHQRLLRLAVLVPLLLALNYGCCASALRSDRLQSGCLQRRGSRGRCQELHEARGLLRLGRLGEHAGREHRRLLQLDRQRPHHIDARHHHQLADLLHGEFHLPACGQLRREAARNDRRLGVDLFARCRAARSAARTKSRWHRCASRRSTWHPAAPPSAPAASRCPAWERPPAPQCPTYDRTTSTTLSPRSTPRSAS